MGHALSWAWDRFTKNPAALIVSYLIYGVVSAAFSFASQLVSGINQGDNADSNVGVGWVWLVVGALLSVASYLWEVFTTVAAVSGCLDIADGKPVTIGSFFRPRNFGRAILAWLLVAVITFVGLVLCIIPGIIFIFMSMFTTSFVVDRSLGAVEAVKASVATVRSNLSEAVLVAVVWIALAVIVPVMTCGLGALVSAPVARLLLTYSYRRLSGGQVTPLTV